MKLLAVGLDHRTAPTSIRERIAFEGERGLEGLRHLKEMYPGSEVVILSTCNRVEIYLAASDGAEMPEVDGLTLYLAGFHGVGAEELASHLVTYHDEAVVAHLFRVASSLESLVLGEGQILGQVRAAYRTAVEQQTIGPFLHRVFEHALRVGKRVRETTGLSQGRVSVASLAVELAREVFDSFSDKTVLVIGAGKMADLTLRHLVELRPGQIVVTNRSRERAEQAARTWRAEVMPFERLGQALIDADVVVSTTAADEAIVTYAMYERVQRARRNRLALILDIAMPRDFEPRIGELDQVMLYDLDDLRGQVDRNREVRKHGIEPAQAVVEEETRACLDALRHHHQAGAILRELGDYADVVREKELDRLFGGSLGFSPEQRSAVEHMAWRLQNQYLHHPRTALKKATEAGQAEQAHWFLHTVRALFGLGAGSGGGSGSGAKPRGAHQRAGTGEGGA